MIKRTLGAALLFSLALIVTSCIPESVNPLCDPDKAVCDPAVLGLWYGGGGSGDDKPFLLHFMAGPKGRVEFVATFDGKDGDDPGSVLGWALTSKAGATNCLSVRVTVNVKPKSIEQPDAASATYMVMRYEVKKDGALELRMLREAAVKEAFEKPSIRGAGDKITDTGENIAKWIAAGDPEKIFEEKPLVFRRVALPEAPKEAPKKE